MVDVTQYYRPNSKILVADDLISGPITVRITNIEVRQDKRPLEIYYDGCGGRPYVPAATIIKVMQAVWGKYTENWIGKSMTLFRDETVVYAGKPDPGIRISHMEMTENPRTRTLILAASNKSNQTIVIQPLEVEKPDWVDLSIGAAEAGMAAYRKFIQSLSRDQRLSIPDEQHEANKKRAKEVDDAILPPIENLVTHENLTKETGDVGVTHEG